MKRQWTEQEINEWYAKQPWLRGTNFLPSDCINRLDMWQSFGREEHLKTAETELKLSEETGFNTVRLWCNFDVYYKEPEEFMQTLESYISLCAKYHHSVMLVLAYEEDLPYGDKFVAKELGAQKEYYNHFNRDYELQDKLMAEHAYKHYTEYPEIKPIYMEMVERVVKKYRADNRILAWNVENEPGITIGSRAVKLQEELFALVRSLDPVQPLAADVWIGINEDGKISLSMKKADENAQQQRPPRRRDENGRPPRQNNYHRREASAPVQSPARPGDYEWRARENSGSFEDMMSRFKQMSDEKISDLKRAENKRGGGYSRKGPRNN